MYEPLLSGDDDGWWDDPRLEPPLKQWNCRCVIIRHWQDELVECMERIFGNTDPRLPEGT